jgi:hypothetical protein
LKTLLKLVIAVAVLNAVYRGGMAAYTYFQIRDQTEQLLVFDTNSTPEQLETAIIQLAQAEGVALTEETVTVERTGARTSARAGYVASVEFFPSVVYPIPLSFDVSSVSTGPLKPGAAP